MCLIALNYMFNIWNNFPVPWLRTSVIGYRYYIIIYKYRKRYLDWLIHNQHTAQNMIASDLKLSEYVYIMA